MGLTISASLNLPKGRRCFLSPVTITSASEAKEHSRTFSSPGSGVAPRARWVGKTRIAESVNASAHSTQE